MPDRELKRTAEFMPVDDWFRQLEDFTDTFAGYQARRLAEAEDGSPIETLGYGEAIGIAELDEMCMSFIRQGHHVALMSMLNMPGFLHKFFSSNQNAVADLSKPNLSNSLMDVLVVTQQQRPRDYHVLQGETAYTNKQFDAAKMLIRLADSLDGIVPVDHDKMSSICLEYARLTKELMLIRHGIADLEANSPDLYEKIYDKLEEANSIRLRLGDTSPGEVLTFIGTLNTFLAMRRIQEVIEGPILSTDSRDLDLMISPYTNGASVIFMEYKHAIALEAASSAALGTTGDTRLRGPEVEAKHVLSTQFEVMALGIKGKKNITAAQKEEALRILDEELQENVLLTLAGLTLDQTYLEYIKSAVIIERVKKEADSVYESRAVQIFESLDGLYTDMGQMGEEQKSKLLHLLRYDTWRAEIVARMQERGINFRRLRKWGSQVLHSRFLDDVKEKEREDAKHADELTIRTLTMQIAQAEAKYLLSSKVVNKYTGGKDIRRQLEGYSGGIKSRDKVETLIGLATIVGQLDHQGERAFAAQFIKDMAYISTRSNILCSMTGKSGSTLTDALDLYAGLRAEGTGYSVSSNLDRDIDKLNRILKEAIEADPLLQDEYWLYPTTEEKLAKSAAEKAKKRALSR